MTDEIRAADLAYGAFPPFSEWQKGCSIDLTKWGHYSERLKALQQSPGDVLKRANDFVLRAAAFDTGAIEGLYDTDEGFTLSVAVQDLALEFVRDHKGPEVAGHFKDQLSAYHKVIDLATQATPIAEAWIRALHSEVCASQSTYPVLTSAGPQQQELPKGTYKSYPNHVRLPDGTVYSYAPVDLTPEEMHRLCSELRQDDFAHAHPVLQASYAHYALVLIHPFADGNGRVARALASVFTCRALSLPFTVLADDKPNYLAALRAADKGDRQQFVDFVFRKCTEAIELLEAGFQTASAPTPEESAATLEAVYKAQRPRSQEDLFRLGVQVLEFLLNELSRQMKTFRLPGDVRISIDGRGALAPLPPSASRAQIQRRASLAHQSRPAEIFLQATAPQIISKKTRKPQPVSASRTYSIKAVALTGPKDIFSVTGGHTTFSVEAEAVAPSLARSVAIRIQLYAEAELRSLVKLLADVAVEASRL